MVQPTKLAQRMKKESGSSVSTSTNNGDSKKRKSPSSNLWGSADFAGYGVNNAGDHSDEQDENRNTENTDNSGPTRKRKSGSSAKIGGAEVKKQPREDTSSKKQKPAATPPSLPVGNTLVNYFNKIQVNDHKKHKESPSPSSQPASQPPPRTVTEPQPTKSLKEMFDRRPPDMIRSKEALGENGLGEDTKRVTSGIIDLVDEAPSPRSSGKIHPSGSGSATTEIRKECSKIANTNSNKVTEARTDEPVTEAMDVDDDIPAEPTPAMAKKSSNKPRPKVTKPKKASINEELEEAANGTTTKGSDTKKRKPGVTDHQDLKAKVDDTEEMPKEGSAKEEPPKNRSMLEYFKVQSKSTVNVSDSAQDRPAAEARVSEEFESMDAAEQDVEQDQKLPDATSKRLPLGVDSPSTFVLIESTTVTSTDSSPERTTKEVVMEEPELAPLVNGASSPSEQVISPQPRRRRLVRASQLQFKSYQESSSSEPEQEEPVHPPRKRRGSKNHKQDDGADRDTDRLPESDQDPEPEPEPIHVAASRHMFKSYFGSTSSLPPKPKMPKEPGVEAIGEKFFDLGATRPVQKTYSKKPASVKKKTPKKRSAFSGSDEPGSDRDSRSDDDLSDFDIKVEEKPDPNQKSISSMFSKAPPRSVSFLPTAVKPERRKELTPLSQSLLSGGLVNVGNTCYLNSVLQALRNTPRCTETLISMIVRIAELEKQLDRETNQKNYLLRLFKQVLHVFEDLNVREGRDAADQIYERTLCPKQVVEILRGGKSQFNTSGQQDAPEFLLYLVSHCFDEVQKLAWRMIRMLEEDLKQKDETEMATSTTFPTTTTMATLTSTSRSTSSLIECEKGWTPVNDLFQIGTERVQVCAKCDKVTTKQDRDFDLTVQIDTSNPGLVRDLEWGVSDTMKQEVTTEDNKRFCERCKSNEHAQMSNFFISLPKVMILRLQRSNFMQGAVKIPNGVACSQRMNFKQWMSSNYQGDHPDYELSAIIVHRGRDIFAGHYFAYIQKDVEIETIITEPDGESWTEKKSYSWLKYNDSSVDPVSDEDMAKLFSGNIKKGASSASCLEENKNHVSGEDKMDFSALTSTLEDHVATPYVYLYRRLDT
ncbi:Ubiquitin carboxyl-terminal hydrolase 25 [Mortierella sp. AD032]|nr:Ubiquitin carboxyl-terminal hydrolase 25 [Mortierella sp. AD032]